MAIFVVTDNMTGLMWVKAPHALSGNSGGLTWNNAWYLHLYHGDVDGSFKTTQFRVWPVRAGQ